MEISPINGTSMDQSADLQQFYQHPARKLTFIVLHTVTLSLLAAFAKTMHARVEIKHPVFAIIFQQIVVFGICEFACFILRLVLLANPELPLFYPILSIWICLQQFHQVTWLVVTSLRYHILFKSNSSIDIQSLTRKSLCLVWILFPIQGTFTCVVWFSWLFKKGWPEGTSFYSINWPLWEMTTQFAGFNLPDFFSLIIYIIMLRILRHQASIQVVPENEAAQNDDQNAVVWAGPANIVHNLEAEVPEPPPQIQGNNSDEKSKIVKKLSVHILFCLLDFFVLLLVRLLAFPDAGGIAIHILIYVYAYVFCLWIPLVVIKANCKGLDGMLQYVISLIFSV